MSERYYFAWCRGLTGVIPVKFDDEVSRPRDAMIVYKLNDDECKLGLTELAIRYPYKE